MHGVRRRTDARLVAYGRKLAGMVTAYLARVVRVFPTDALNLLAARAEWWEREAGATPPHSRTPPSPSPSRHRRGEGGVNQYLADHVRTFALYDFCSLCDTMQPLTPLT